MRRISVWSVLLASTIAMSTATTAYADSQWAAATTTFPGNIRAGSREVPVKPGDKTVVAIKNLQAGTTVTMLNGTEVLTPKPLTADEKGNLNIPLTVPADAATGLHPLTVITQNPASVSQVMLKLSRIVPPKNTEAFRLQTTSVGERAYQSAVSADGKLFVTSARGPKDGSRLMRLNAGTLAIEAEATLPKDKKGEQIGVFGVGVDNAHNQVWTTNTLAETVTVYDAKTLSVVKVFPEGSVSHPRDVVIDEANNRAYVSAALTGFVEVYDTKTLEHIGQLEFVVERGKNLFNSTDLTLDSAGGKLYGVSRDTLWVGWIDLKTGKSTTVKVPQAQGATDIARDPQTGRLYVASQEMNNIVVLDADGKVLADTYIGAGGVSVVWDPLTSQVFAATRAGGTVAVLNKDGKLVANIPMDNTPNNLTAGPDGAVYLVSMYGTTGDKVQTGSVTKITAQK
ncbi:TPA: beta-propeller fold lactonase family protein [Klebsiella variicola]|uniref:YncE family protein n=1 Tax=Klebsiella variicola TaxID=244366 RepID=UPI000E2AAC88|nr:beta-propeller fold lactonase family protein [Klebsiella variicola]SXE76617.1 putative receptor [Klebsiella variicola]HBQ0384676.1 beta-propeller fold lactonase family protein [Klebsiella variicola]HCC2287740.1 beta-propeller fold lactonase family protein [Klebsiella variicola]HDK6004210.1 beta-propeller fold lactonase family protein [Klebsiella variicola]HDK6502326.1 beta-propeller fold lactonase family protein [Klebsiella variicola]